MGWFTLEFGSAKIAESRRHMKNLLLCILVSLGCGLSAQAQTRIRLDHVRAITGGDTLQGSDAVLVLNGSTGAGDAMVLQAGELMAKVHVRLSTNSSARSSMKDSAVRLHLSIAMRSGRDKDNREVDKVFYLDQQRSATINQRFNFKDGIAVHGVTLQFDIHVE